MSRRHLRKLEALQALKKAEPVSKKQEEEEEEEEEEDTPVVPTVARNRFDLLLEGSENGGDADSEDEGRPSNSSSPDEHAPPTTNVSVRQKTKKKKKKKKKNKPVKFDTTDASEENELDEVEASVREVNALLGEATVAAAPPSAAETGRLSSASRSHLLSIDYQFLDAALELQKMFGSDVVIPDRSRGQRGLRHNPRGGNRARGGSRASLAGVMRYAAPYDNGLTMLPDDTHPNNGVNGMNVFMYRFELAYERHQYLFDDALEIQDQQAILNLLHDRSHHIHTLLYLSGMFRSQEDFTYADDLVQRAIMELEHSMHRHCRLTDVNSTLDYRRFENRGLFFALFYHMLSVARRRCFRSALELCKVLMRLSADGDDPLAAMLIVDLYALRSHEYLWLLDYYNTYNDELNLAMLPNLAFSVPLACFYLSTDSGNTIGHRALRQRLQDFGAQYTKQQLRAKADEMLQQALIMFPEMLAYIFNANNVKPSAEVQSCQFFYNSNRPGPLHVIFHLYGSRMGLFWNEPDVLSWLQAMVRSVMVTVAQDHPSVAQARTARAGSFGSIPLPIQRHLVITNFELLLQYVDEYSLAEAQRMYHDVLPPRDSRRHYIVARPDPRRAGGAGNPSRGLFTDFFATLIPQGYDPQPLPRTGEVGLRFNTRDRDLQEAFGLPQPPAPPLGAAAAAGGAAADGDGTASGAPQPATLQSFRYFLESARSLLDSSLFRARGDEEDEDEAAGGEEWLEEDSEEGEEEEGGSSSCRRDDDFNEDQDQI